MISLSAQAEAVRQRMLMTIRLTLDNLGYLQPLVEMALTAAAAVAKAAKAKAAARDPLEPQKCQLIAKVAGAPTMAVQGMDFGRLWNRVAMVEMALTALMVVTVMISGIKIVFIFTQPEQGVLAAVSGLVKVILYTRETTRPHSEAAVVAAILVAKAIRVP